MLLIENYTYVQATLCTYTIKIIEVAIGLVTECVPQSNSSSSHVKPNLVAHAQYYNQYRHVIN